MKSRLSPHDGFPPHMLRSPLRTVALSVCAVLLMLPSSAIAQGEEMSIFELERQEEGEPVWAPLLRLRSAKERFQGNRRKWAAYAQLRAQQEALLGRHENALRLWDSWRPASGDSVASLLRGPRPYRGFVVGFCNPGCRDDFVANAEDRPEDRRYFDTLIHEHDLDSSTHE